MSSPARRGLNGMTTFLLLPGAGSTGALWDGVAAELRRRGHVPVPVDLPCDDPAAALPEYVDAAVAALGPRADVRGDLVVVGQSLGAFTAAAVCARVPVDLLVFLAAMIPVPGETAGTWWRDTRHAEAIPDVLARHGDLSTWGEDALHDVFLHDLTPAQLEQSLQAVTTQTDGIFASPLPADGWPTVPTRVLLCRDDRLFPADFQRRLARERLGLVADEMDGGHLAMLSRPAELAERLIDLAGADTAAQPAA